MKPHNVRVTKIAITVPTSVRCSILFTSRELNYSVSYPDDQDGEEHNSRYGCSELGHDHSTKSSYRSDESYKEDNEEGDESGSDCFEEDVHLCFLIY